MSGNSPQPREQTTPEARLLACNTFDTDVEAIMTALPHGVIIGDANGLIRANRRALHLLDLDHPQAGAPVMELIAGARLTHAIGGRHMAPADHPFAQALLGRNSACEASLEDPATERRLSLRCHGAPLRRNGILVGAMTVYSDISDLRRTTEVLRKTNQELREFSAILAHDLHEPLRMISSFLDLARMRESVQQDEKALHYLTSTAQCALRTRTLIDHLLKLTSAGRPLRRTSTDIRGVVREALENLSVAMQESKAEVAIGDLPQIYADRAQLLLVFQNLLSNAAKYADDARPLRVAITAERRDGDTVFAVADNGIGIAPEECRRIFDPFDRLHLKDGATGSGLGLTICRRVVSRHGGDIWAESAPGDGTIFKFTIPHHAQDGALEPLPGIEGG